VYDSTFKAPVCQEVGEGCVSGSLLASAGPGETNQPNTIFSACPDGSALASIESILVSTLDGTPLTAGKAARITVFIRPGDLDPIAWTV
jgi:leucyl aminopeptidase